MPDSQNAVIIPPPGIHTGTVIWLHGLGADGHDFVPIVPELGLPDQHGIKFVFPHAPIRPVTINGGMSMRAWYDVRNTDLRRMEDAVSIHASATLVNEFIQAEMDNDIDSGKILVAGFSQGGAIALHAGLRYPDTLAGILALSTYLPLPGDLVSESSPANLNTPVMMCHGIMDPVIPVDAGQQSYEQLVGAGYRVDWYTYPMAHAVCIEEIRDIAVWLAERLPAG